MSKFKELQTTAEETERKVFEYRDRSYQNLSILVTEFVRYCEIPSDRFSWRPLDKEPEPRAQYNVVSGTHFGKDGYWHAGFVIDLTSADNEFPRRHVLFEFCIAERNGSLMVKAGRDGRELRLDLGSETERNKFYDALAGRAKKILSTELIEMPDDGVRKIGFTA